MTGQTGQDRWLYANLFHHWRKAGKVGTYVDLAAAWPRSHSNTWFFDRCLGWRGLCIEADPRKRELWTNPKEDGLKRSCHYEETCVSDSAKEVSFLSYTKGPSSLNSKVVEDSKKTSGHGDVTRIPCSRFDAVLRKHNITHIDFLSLDIESHEAEALRSLDFGAVTIDVIITETARNTPRVRPILERAGFRLLGEVGFDTVYLHERSAWHRHCTWDVGTTHLKGYNREDKHPRARCKEGMV